MNTFVNILKIVVAALDNGLTVYAKRADAQSALVNNARYCVECLRATINGTPLPKL